MIKLLQNKGGLAKILSHIIKYVASSTVTDIHTTTTIPIARVPRVDIHTNRVMVEIEV